MPDVVISFNAKSLSALTTVRKCGMTFYLIRNFEFCILNYKKVATRLGSHSSKKSYPK